MAAAATLIVGPSWVGDMVMAGALVRLLERREPGRPVDMLAPAWSLPVVARMKGVREGISADTAHGELGLWKRRRIGRTLAGRYDRAIVLPRSLKAALIPWFAGIPTRTGFRGEHRYGLINDMRPFDARQLDQTVKRFAALGLGAGEALTDIPNPVLHVDAGNQRVVMARLGLSSARPAVAMMPGAEYGPAKCWPLEHFTALARMLEDDGYAVWVLGSEKDKAGGAAIAAGSQAIDLCGRTSLEDVIDLLAFAVHAVSNDSGLMHVAAAVGTMTHAIYGSSSPHFTPPLTERRTVHWLGLDCSPCFERECPLGHLRCLKDIDPDRVRTAISAADRS